MDVCTDAYSLVDKDRLARVTSRWVVCLGVLDNLCRHFYIGFRVDVN